MKRQTRSPLLAALGAAARALQQGRDGPEVAEQIRAAAMRAAQPSPPRVPTGGGLPDSLRGAVGDPRHAAAPAVPPVDPRLASAPTFPAAPDPASAPASPAPDRRAQAEAALDAVTRDGTAEEIVTSLLAYEQVESDTLSKELLDQGVPPAAVTRMVAERRAQAAQENNALLSQVQAMEHATMMSIIQNIHR